MTHNCNCNHKYRQEIREAFFPKEFVPLRAHELPPIYGDEKDLSVSIEKFDGFAGSDTFFEKKGFTIPYPIIRKNLKYYEGKNGKKYAYKHDIFAKIQHLFEGFPNDTEAHLLYISTLAYFLKTKEKDLRKQFELVECDESVFEDLAKRVKDNIEQKQKKPISEYKKKKKEKEKEKEYFNKWKKFLPNNNDDQEYLFIKNLLNYSIRKLEPNVINQVYRRSEQTIEVFNLFMEKNPDWFRPKKEYAIVRLFQDQKFEFVFAGDLLRVMRKENMDVSELMKVWNLDKFAIIQKEQILEIIGETNMEKIEFVFIPIVRSVHRVTYIPAFKGIYCIPAVDVIVEVLHDAIQGKNLLQQIKQEEFDQVFDLFKDLKIFNAPCSLTRPFLIETKEAKYIREWCDGSFCMSVRRLNKNEDFEITFDPKKLYGHYPLKDQMEDLGISKNFPEIKKILDEVFENWKNTLREEGPTHKAYAELHQYLQLAYIYKKLPIVTKFFHAQKACHRLFLKCNYCAAEEWIRNVEDVLRKGFSQFDDVEDWEITQPPDEGMSKFLAFAKVTEFKGKREVKKRKNFIRTRRLRFVPSLYFRI